MPIPENFENELKQEVPFAAPEGRSVELGLNFGNPVPRSWQDRAYTTALIGFTAMSPLAATADAPPDSRPVVRQLVLSKGSPFLSAPTSDSVTRQVMRTAGSSEPLTGGVQILAVGPPEAAQFSPAVPLPPDMTSRPDPVRIEPGSGSALAHQPEPAPAVVGGRGAIPVEVSVERQQMDQTPIEVEVDTVAWGQQRRPAIGQRETPSTTERETESKAERETESKAGREAESKADSNAAPAPVLPGYTWVAPAPREITQDAPPQAVGDNRTEENLSGSAHPPSAIPATSAPLVRRSEIVPDAKREPPSAERPETATAAERPRDLGNSDSKIASVPLLADGPDPESFRVNLSMRSTSPERDRTPQQPPQRATPLFTLEEKTEPAPSDRRRETPDNFENRSSAPVAVPAESGHAPAHRDAAWRASEPLAAPSPEAPPNDEGKLNGKTEFAKGKAEFAMRWPQAGGVSVELIDRNGTVDVTVRAANPEIRAHLEVHLPELVVDLERAGFEVTPAPPSSEPPSREPEFRGNEARDPGPRRDAPGTNPDSGSKERRDRRSRRPGAVTSDQRRLPVSGFEPIVIAGRKD